MILSHGMPNASKVRMGRMLVEAPVSIKALLFWKAPKKAITYKGLSPSMTLLAKSLEEKVTNSLVSWYATRSSLPWEAAAPYLLSITWVRAWAASLLANGLRPILLSKACTLSSYWIHNVISSSCNGAGATLLLAIFSTFSSIGLSHPMKPFQVCKFFDLHTSHFWWPNHP